jgi:hypothetical protein
VGLLLSYQYPVSAHHFLDSFDFPLCSFWFGRMEEQFLPYFAQILDTYVIFKSSTC